MIAGAIGALLPALVFAVFGDATLDPEPVPRHPGVHSVSTVKRYQVKIGNKAWTAKGPDLLRPRAQARGVLARALVDKPARMFTKVNDNDWKKAGGKVAVMEKFDGWRIGELKVGLRKAGKIRPIAVVRVEQVRLLDLSSSSPGTELVHSLIQHRFPGIKFGGAYVYKMSSSTSWSDHAWGTAVDETENPSRGIHNDEVTDWVARMAAANCMNFDYALGSRAGGVVIVDGDSGDMDPSGASSSHKWHVHVSVVDHDGAKPPRTGGVY